MSQTSSTILPIDSEQPPVKHIHLERAVNHIRQACNEQEQNGQHSPFFFIVGAGVSVPSIPLANTIIEECKKLAIEMDRPEETDRKNPVDVYSHWFQAAFPQPVERQTYLRRKIEAKPISPANFRLAHLLLHKKIANIVVTPNFDDLLQRALALFGRTSALLHKS